MNVRTMTFAGKLSRQVHENLDGFLEQQRQLWNGALEERIGAYTKAAKSVSYNEQQASLTKIRKEVGGFDRYQTHSQRTALRRLDKAFKSFFRRVKNGQKPGFPRFKSKGGVRSFDIPVGASSIAIRTKGEWNSVSIKGIGRIRFKGEIDGEVKLVRVIKTPRRVKVQVIVERHIDVALDQREPLGIDVGIKSRITLSNGFQSPKNVVDREEIKARQRRFSLSRKRSNSRRKKGIALAKSWQRTKERELGLLHELTANLIKNHGSKFYVEDLRIDNMAKNRFLARSIYEQQWGTFITLLTYKAEEAGGWVRKVNPKNTSQWCSQCGGLPSRKLTLKDRLYTCEHCGLEEDRDVNAAKNIRTIGARTYELGGMRLGFSGCPTHRADGRGAANVSLAQDAERCLVAGV